MGIMIHTIKPYAHININEVHYRLIRLDRFYMLDKYGLWEITKETYEELTKRGIKEYERVCSTL